MIYSRLYESLQYTLCRLSWPNVLTKFFASGSRSRLLRQGPFPGFWTCKTGIILWKQTIESPVLRTFPLHHDRCAPVQELTKCYWHLTFGNNAFATNHRSLLLSLLRKHDKLLQLYKPVKSVNRDEKSSVFHPKLSVNHAVKGEGEQISTPPTGYYRVISVIHTSVEHTVRYLRARGYSEPLFVDGKARVRWRCVSGLYLL